MEQRLGTDKPAYRKKGDLFRGRKSKRYASRRQESATEEFEGQVGDCGGTAFIFILQG